MPLDPQQVAEAEDQRHAEQLEQSMIVMATVLLRKLGRRRVLISQDDIQKAVAEGLAEVHNPPGDDNAVVYELPPKPKKGKTR